MFLNQHPSLAQVHITEQDKEKIYLYSKGVLSQRDGSEGRDQQPSPFVNLSVKYQYDQGTGSRMMRQHDERAPTRLFNTNDYSMNHQNFEPVPEITEMQSVQRFKSSLKSTNDQTVTMASMSRKKSGDRKMENMLPGNQELIKLNQHLLRMRQSKSGDGTRCR